MGAAALINNDFDSEFDLVEDPDRIDEAKHRAQRGEYKEALYQLSVALGRDFDWLATLKPEDLA